MKKNNLTQVGMSGMMEHGLGKAAGPGAAGMLVWLYMARVSDKDWKHFEAIAEARVRANASTPHCERQRGTASSRAYDSGALPPAPLRT
jgi:hypothetical protein